MERLGFYRLDCDFVAFYNHKRLQDWFYGQLVRLNNQIYVFAVSRGGEKKCADKFLEINRFFYWTEYPSDEKIAEQMRSISGHGTNAVYHFEKLDGNPSDYNTALFELYEEVDHLEPKMKIDTRLDEQSIQLLQKMDKWNTYPIVAFGEDETQARDFDNTYHGTMAIRPFTRLYCSRCGHYFFPQIGDRGHITAYCPNCDNRSNIVITSKDYDVFLKNHFLGYRSNILSSVTENGYFVQKIDNGIVISRFVRKMSASNGNFIDDYTVTHRIVHQIGGEIEAYRCWKSGKNIPCDVFDALHINSKSAHFIGNVIYEGYANFVEFAKDNEKFLRMCGFLEISKYARHVNEMQSFFVLFIAIMNKYPIFEQLVKMGYVYLFFDLYCAILKSDSKAEISDIVNGLSELIDMDTMQGSHALRFPPYIGEYLRSKSAKLPEYYVWRDFYELTGITKENFLKVINSVEYSLISPYVDLNDLVNALKFDYPLLKLLKYLLKGAYDAHSIRERLQLLTDYLMMCDMLRVSIDKYPQDLKGVHDKIAKEFKSLVGNDGRDKILYQVGSSCENYVNAKIRDDTIGVPKLLQKYAVTCPKSVRDFIDEGNQQHNCVGSYPDLVIQGKTIVFFIRDKETPNVSFITGECLSTGLGQLYYSNNRAVSNEGFVNLGRWIARQILQGCKTREIFGHRNIGKR